LKEYNTMAGEFKEIRRVVTGNDEQGRSKVVWDGNAPNSHRASMSPGRGHTDLWIWDESPAPLSGTEDAGNFPYVFPAPPKGGHLRVVQSVSKPDDYDPAKDPAHVPYHDSEERAEGRTWEKGGDNMFSSANHMTQSIDYGICMAGERVLSLDDGSELSMKRGDIVIQVGAWHRWSSPREPGMMMFDMFAVDFTDALGTPEGNDKPIPPLDASKLPAGVKPARRIVTYNKPDGLSALLSDGPSPDVHTDPARPGFASTRLWVTDSTPAKLRFETLHLPHTIEPPANGTVCRVLNIPPDAGWQGKVGATEVAAYFESMGSPGASTYSPDAPHPYMQKTETLDFGVVLDGEITLVLDTEEVNLKTGDIAIMRGANYAWSNRSSQTATVAVASHDGAA
jgi:hypothetical protein